MIIQALRKSYLFGALAITACELEKSDGKNIYDHDSWHLNYDENGYDRSGYHRDGYDRNGFDRMGRDKDGYDIDGRDWLGRDKEGYDRSGYHRDGYDRNGFNRMRRDRDGYDIDGLDWLGRDKEGYNREGYDSSGYDREGYNRWSGRNRDGYNRRGVDRQGFGRNETYRPRPRPDTTNSTSGPNANASTHPTPSGLSPDIEAEILNIARGHRYSGSEAELLKNKFRERALGTTSIYSVTYQGRVIDISHVPNMGIRGYRARSERAAEAMGIRVGEAVAETSLTETQRDFIGMILMENDSAQHLEMSHEIANPVFDNRPIEADSLNATQQVTFELRRRQEEYLQISFRESNGLLLHTDSTQQAAFIRILDAIETSNLEVFLEETARLATRFGANHEPKEGFVGTMAYLFVNKKFSSEGMMLCYFHFMLQCGIVN